MERSSCVKKEGSQENSQGRRCHQTGGSEAGGKGDASQSTEHEASAVEGVGEGSHGGGEGQWSAKGPSCCHWLENSLDSSGASVEEEKHEADERENRATQFAAWNLSFTSPCFLLLLIDRHVVWGESKVDVSNATQDTPQPTDEERPLDAFHQVDRGALLPCCIQVTDGLPGMKIQRRYIQWINEQDEVTKLPRVPGVLLQGREEGLDEQGGEKESNTNSGVQSLVVMILGGV